MRRFSRKQSLVTFAGIDPVPNNSGDYCSRSNKVTKRGSPYLRKTLFNITTVHLQRDPQTSRYSSLWTRNGQKANRVLCLHDRCREQVSEPLLRWPILLHWRTFRLWTWILPAYSVRNNQSLFDFLGRHFYGDLLSYFFLLPHI